VGCAIVICVCGVQSGCVTVWAMEEIFQVEGAGPDPDYRDSRPPSSGWLLKRIGLAALVLPFSLSADLVVAACFGWLIYDDDDDDDEPEDCRAPPGLVRTR